MWLWIPEIFPDQQLRIRHSPFNTANSVQQLLTVRDSIIQQRHEFWHFHLSLDILLEVSPALMYPKSYEKEGKKWKERKKEGRVEKKGMVVRQKEEEKNEGRRKKPYSSLIAEKTKQNKTR